MLCCMCFETTALKLTMKLVVWMLKCRTVSFLSRPIFNFAVVIIYDIINCFLFQASFLNDGCWYNNILRLL